VAVKEAVARLKTSALTIPLDSDEFLVETDASERAVGAVLSVKHDNCWSPVEFFSQKLSITQKRWPVREREAYAIVAALAKFDCYLRGRKFQVHTDHQSLQWMLKSQKGKIARWASLLAEYDMDIYYKKGKELAHVDFLSRSLDTEPDPMITDRMVYFTTTLDQLPKLQEIIQAQREIVKPVGKGFTGKDDVIYYHGKFWVPPSHRTIVIAAFHAMPPYLHPGSKKTHRALVRVFNWPGAYQDVVRYIQACLYCQRARSGKERLQGLLRTHPVPGPFETVYLDFWEGTYNAQRFVVLTVVDQLTKWAEAIPVKSKRAEVIAPLFLMSWVYRFGVPKHIISDHGRTFVSQVATHLYTRLGTTRLTSTPYHPEGHGVVESFHWAINKYFRYIDHATLPFDEALAMALFAYRCTLHLTTGNSPAYLLYGFDPRLPRDVDWRIEPQVEQRERFKFLSTLRLDVQLRAHHTRFTANEHRNQGRRDVRFEVGQLVLVEALPTEARAHWSSSYKMVPKWSLPARVERVLSQGKAAVVRDLLTSKCREVHLQHIRFILPPEIPLQRQEWSRALKAEAMTMFDPKVRQSKLQQFFEALDQPQLVKDSRKRPRLGSESEGAHEEIIELDSDT